MDPEMTSLRTHTVAIEATMRNASDTAIAVTDAVNAACAGIEEDGGRILLPITYWSVRAHSEDYGRSAGGSTTIDHENQIFASITFEKS